MDSVRKPPPRNARTATHEESSDGPQRRHSPRAGPRRARLRLPPLPCRGGRALLRLLLTRRWWCGAVSGAAPRPRGSRFPRPPPPRCPWAPPLPRPPVPPRPWPSAPPLSVAGSAAFSAPPGRLRPCRPPSLRGRLPPRSGCMVGPRPSPAPPVAGTVRAAPVPASSRKEAGREGDSGKWRRRAAAAPSATRLAAALLARASSVRSAGPAQKLRFNVKKITMLKLPEVSFCTMWGGKKKVPSPGGYLLARKPVQSKVCQVFLHAPEVHEQGLLSPSERGCLLCCAWARGRFTDLPPHAYSIGFPVQAVIWRYTLQSLSVFTGFLNPVILTAQCCQNIHCEIMGCISLHYHCPW